MGGPAPFVLDGCAVRWGERRACRPLHLLPSGPRSRQRSPRRPWRLHLLTQAARRPHLLTERTPGHQPKEHHTEPATPTTNPVGTSTQVSILLGPDSEITARDNPQASDLVSLRFDDGTTVITGDLATIQRLVDEAAHQLMLISTARANTQEQATVRDAGLAHVNGLRDTAAAARAGAMSA